MNVASVFKSSGAIRRPIGLCRALALTTCQSTIGSTVGLSRPRDTYRVRSGGPSAFCLLTSGAWDRQIARLVTIERNAKPRNAVHQRGQPAREFDAKPGRLGHLFDQLAPKRRAATCLERETGKVPQTGKTLVITEADRRMVFERDYGPRVEAKMIMLDNFRRAQEVWHKATQEKEDFSRLAREFSIEPNSRALGGVIPDIRKHVGSKKVVEEAFKLKPGEISGIIQTGSGRYVILLCESITEPKVSYEDVRDLIEEHLREEKRQDAVAKIFEQLKKEIRVDNYITGTSTATIRQTSATSTRNAPGTGKVVPVARNRNGGATNTSPTRSTSRR